MVNTVKVLKRKDASSVIVAVVIAMIVIQFLTMVTVDLASTIANTDDVNLGWKNGYLLPTVTALVQLVALDILIWVYGALHNLVSK